MAKIRVLIMAGGTGGHVFPALAVARNLIKQGVEVEWLGTKKGIESTLIPKESIPIHYITVSGLRGKNLLTLLLAPFRLVKAIQQSVKIIKQFKPQMILGMGGFASGPGGLAAWWLGVPLVIHEQNAIAGFTNRVLARFAKKVLAGFPESFPKSISAIYTGNPVRNELTTLPTVEERLSKEKGSIKLLVLGGSLGAKALNELCPEAMALIPAAERPDIWHQTGQPLLKQTEEAYQIKQIKAKVDPFINDMAHAYAWADLVLCRAGALTVAELAASGRPSILIPFPFAVDDHQTHNALFLSQEGAAELIQQNAIDPGKLADMIMRFSCDRAALIDMANKAQKLGQKEALSIVAEHCMEVCNERKMS